MKKRKNKIKCLKCGDIIESTYRHDFKMCKCGNCGVDGGLDYFKRTGTDYEEIADAFTGEDFKKYSKYEEPERILATDSTATPEGLPRDDIDLEEIAPNYERMWNELKEEIKRRIDYYEDFEYTDDFEQGAVEELVDLGSKIDWIEEKYK